mmetsp:Transcript_8958/g.16836  ORF Transcript_8958/g.16836 Transcript_8958/m.16836 type:complete len:247 (-) Transcript_8958:1336-2076(-)
MTGGETRSYDTKEYWEGRYNEDARKGIQTSGSEDVEETDEWCFSYEELRPLIEDFNVVSGDVVDLGCGVSTMIIEMSKSGWLNIERELVGLDFSKSAVSRLKQISLEEKLPGNVKFELLDIQNIQEKFAPESVAMFIDKMTLDGILCGGETKYGVVQKILEGISTCLVFDGVYVLVTQMDHEENGDFFTDHMLEGLKSPACHWNVGVHVSESDIRIYTFEKKKRRCSPRSKRFLEPGLIQLKVYEH